MIFHTKVFFCNQKIKNYFLVAKKSSWGRLELEQTRVSTRKQFSCPFRQKGFIQWDFALLVVSPGSQAHLVMCGVSEWTIPLNPQWS